MKISNINIFTFVQILREKFRQRTIAFECLVIVIVLTMMAIFSQFFYSSELYNEYRMRKQDRLKIQTTLLERTLNDIFSHTNEVLSILSNQIVNKKDLQEIEQVIKRFYNASKSGKINPLAWTPMSWVDTRDHIVLNANEGIFKQSIDISILLKEQKTKQHPEVLRFGNPTIGPYVKKPVLPTSFGILSSIGEYQGALAVAFKLDELTFILNDAISEVGVRYLVVDLDMKPIISKCAKEDMLDCAEFLKENLDAIKKDNKFSLISSKNVQIFSVRKVQCAPYYVITFFDKIFLEGRLNAIKQMLQFGILTILGMSLLFMLYFYFKVSKPLKTINECFDYDDLYKPKERFKRKISHTILNLYTHVLKMRHLLDLSYKQQHNLLLKVSEIQDSFCAKHKFLSDISLESLNDAKELMLTKKVLGEPLCISTFDFYECLKTVIRIQKAELLTHDIQVKIDVFTNEMPIEADPLLVTQMLVQLLSRSIHYSTEGTYIYVSIELKVIDKTSYYCVTFSDQSFGLSNFDRARIHDFVHPNKTHFDQYTDYTLEHVSAILILHNGYISFKDRPGKGSIVSVLLPCKQDHIHYAQNVG